MIYFIQHFWAGHDEPTVRLVEAEDEPSIEQVVEALNLDFDPKFEEIVINPADIVKIS